MKKAIFFNEDQIDQVWISSEPRRLVKETKLYEAQPFKNAESFNYR